MTNLIAIAILLVTIGVVVWRLPKIDFGYSARFKRRRILNWVPMGLTYAFLYMGRYNLKVSQQAFEEMPNAAGNPIMSTGEFAIIFGVGTVVYGLSFILNGPMTDRIGGKKAILIGAGGAAVMNLLMGLGAWSLTSHGLLSAFLTAYFVPVYSVLYAANMYFQSFGAAAIVKVNAPWFHVRERGMIGALFGILISLGVYFAFDWSDAILDIFGAEEGVERTFGLPYVFAAPALLLTLFIVWVSLGVKNTPGEAGFEDFDTADASSGDDGPRLGAFKVFRMMVRNPVIMTIALIEFCSGFLRQAIMQFFRTFAKHTDETLHLKSSFVYDNWGLLLCCAGILGGTFAGLISDHVFKSRRGPVAALLYGVMLVCALVLARVYQTEAVGYLVVFMSLAIIGVHGMLSGTASMDFGGRKNAGTAVGLIDGFVYAGTGVMSFTYWLILPDSDVDQVTHEVIGPTTDPANWLPWPVAMIPVAAIGLFLAIRIWNAKPKAKALEEKKEQEPEKAPAKG